MQTNRLTFQNQDESFTTGTNTATQGACVIKASKGLNIPQYIQKGDTNTLLNLFGAPSSTYPGVQEALDYLNYYSLWISAPGGAGSYFGGSYLTTLGSLEPFYNVNEDATGAPSVNFLTSVSSGNGSPLAGSSATALAGDKSYISVTNIPSQFFIGANLSGVILHFTRSNGTAATVNYVVNSASSLLTVNGITYGTISANSITLNASSTYVDTTSTYYDLDFTNTLTNPNFENSGYKVQWIYNIQSYVCMAIYQNSPRSIPGTFSLATPFAVDTRQLIYPQYQATFQITAGGGALIGPSTSFSFTVCGVPLSFITPNTGTGSTITTAPSLVTAIQVAMAQVYIPGYTFVYSGSSIVITYTNTVATPSLVLNTTGTGFDTAFAVTYQFTGTSSTAVNGVVTLSGINQTVSGVTTSASLVTQIGSTFTSIFPSYTFNTSQSALGQLTILYPTYIVVPPSLSLGSAFVGYGNSVYAQSIIPLGIVKTNTNYNTVTFTYSELSYTGNTYNYTTTISPDNTKTDLSGNSLYASTVLAGNNFLGSISYQPLYNLISGYSWGVKSTTLEGVRYISSSSYSPSTLGNVLNLGWSEMSLPSMQNTVKVFFEPECVPSLVPTLASLRETTYPFSTFITGIRVSDGVTTSPSAVSGVVNNILAVRSTYPDLTGLAYYCNEFYMSENYNATSYWNIPLGSIASMLSLIIDSRLGGAAPMYTNEGTSPAVGGQLNKVVVKQKYNFGADNLDILDSNGINPIILDTFYGLMITSQKTAQSSLNLTDWSYIGHQMAFDLFESELKLNVMIPQLGKLIDNYHMNLRSTQAQLLLNKRLAGATAIWSDGKVYVSEVNTPATLAQNNFMIKIRVKVTPFSEYVTLIFSNVGQTSSVSVT